MKLNIYDSDEKIVAAYENKRIRMGLLEFACEINEEIAGKSTAEVVKLVKKLIFELFPNMTEEHYGMADINDLMNCFKGIMKLSKN